MSDLKHQYAQAEINWKQAFRVAFLQRIKASGFDDGELIHYAGITPAHWERLKSRDNISDETEVYAKLYYHLGIKEANPVLLPPKYLVTPLGHEMGKPRAWTTEQYKQWEVQQKTAFHLLSQEGVDVSDVENLLALVLEMITSLVNSDPTTRERFHRANYKMLTVIVPLLTALSKNKAERERALITLSYLLKLNL